MPNHKLLPALLLLLLLSGCSNLTYYSQAIKGHFEINGSSRPIDRLIANPETDSNLAAKLRHIQTILGFAKATLRLPDNGSYREYADLQRRYVTWTLVATEEFSIEPRRWCFPLFGCLSYRGYFQRRDAATEAAKLQKAGLDVSLTGSTAYSSLGWSRDPVLNTMLNQADERLAETIFHELAHQRLYLQDDTAFNEAFAVTVATHGAGLWLKKQGKTLELARYRRSNRQRRQFRQLIGDSRSRLQQLYASGMDEQSMRKHKARLFERMRQDYRRLKQGWANPAGYDRWMEQPLNNAHMALVATYQEMAPLFQQLLERCGNDLERFYRAAQSLEGIAQPERRRHLQKTGCGNS